MPKRSAPRLLLYGFLMPMWRHLQIGEGALMPVNLALIWVRRPALAEGLAASLLSMAVLTVMYQLNDQWDARDDLANPRKDKELARALLENAPFFYRAQAVLTAAAVAAAFAWGGRGRGLCALAVFAVNALYSTKLKGAPVLDVLAVALWGGLFVSLSGAPARTCAMLGLLTAVCHVFQMLIDRDADLRNGVRTTAVASYPLMLGLLLVLCAGVAAGLRPALGAGAAFAFTPFVIELAFKNKNRIGPSYVLNKVYCAVVILLIVLEPAIAAH